MGYEVLARKWRPQQFGDVVGQEHVTTTLQNAITSNRLAHAYLFAGPRGTGKTSLARIFAKALNCAGGPKVDPCDACDSCREIMKSTNLDVIEIDGASNNGVDQVRDLRNAVKLAATRGPYKIYIIDEVHMLSTAAFNALLKTLEEPPPHVKFLFATTEPDKILATILSRCQRFDLRRIPVRLVVDRLRHIATQEGIKVDDDALFAVARGCEGGLRDASSALDQLASFRGDDIREEDVLSIFGLVARKALDDLAGKVLSGDAKGVIEAVAAIDSAGKDLQRAVVDLMYYFRDLVAYLCAGESSIASADLTDVQAAALREQAGRTDVARALRILDVLTDAEVRMRHALSRRVLCETALIRCARAASVVSLEDVLKAINRLRADAGTPAGVERKPEPAAPAAPPREAPPDAEPRGGAAGARSADAAAPVAEDECRRLTAEWRAVVTKIARAAPLANVLVDARPLRVLDDRVVIGFEPEFGDGLERVDTALCRRAAQRVLEQTLGRKVAVEFVVAGEGAGCAGDSGEGEAPPPAPPPAGTSDGGSNARKRPKGNWADEPAVKKTLDLFDGKIVDVRE